MRGLWRIAAVIGIVIVIALNTLILPNDWMKTPKGKTFIFVFNMFGVVAELFVFFFMNRIHNRTVFNIVLFFGTFYFILILFSGMILAIRLVIFGITYLAHKDSAIIYWFNSRPTTIGVYSLVLIATIVGYIRIDNVKLKTYDVDLRQGQETHGTINAVFISDTHVGCGASRKVLDRMVTLSNGVNPDVIFFTGDANDTSSSEQDMLNLQNAMSQMKSTYGIYYVGGNHDVESDFELDPYFEGTPVRVLNNEAVELKDHLYVAGKKESGTWDVPSFLAENGISKDDAVIYLQHRPKTKDQNLEGVDLMLAGHTHGYRYPTALLVGLFAYNHYGYRDDPELQLKSITTSGVSAWGVHFKFPGSSEVVELNITY